MQEDSVVLKEFDGDVDKENVTNFFIEQEECSLFTETTSSLLPAISIEESKPSKNLKRFLYKCVSSEKCLIVWGTKNGAK